ncbi:MAG: substrate-binding domain-containing protein [Treponema sp.]|nr:substrate-binding domain-containing protein [Treponema sp.]
MTLAEIAEYANVSVGTVDRVIHNRKGVSEKTKKLILEIIDKYGYQPNPIASQLKSNKPLVIGVLLPYLETGCDYYRNLFDGMNQAVKQLNPFKIELKLIDFDRNIPGDAIKKCTPFLEQPFDALITTPVVPEDHMEIISKLGDKPFVYIDTPLGTTQPLVTISQNPYKGGYCAGRIMRMFQNGGKFACVRMYSSAYNLRERVRGFTDYIQKDAGSTVLDELYTGVTDAGYYNFMKELFQKHNDIKGIFVPHAEVNLTAYFLVDQGLKSRVTVIGYDLVEQNRQGLLDGSIDCIIGQRPEQQGLEAVYKLYQYCLLHQQVPARVDMPIDVYFKENII